MLENTENAVVEEVVAPQTEEAKEVVDSTPSENVDSESVETEVAPVAEPKQSKEDNAKFAEVRKKAEREALDKFISDQYGKSHGIHTKAEYDKAMAEQKQNELLESLKDGEVDPKEVYEKMKQNDPEFQQMKKSRQEAYVNTQLSELNTDLKGFGLDIEINSLDDLVKLPNSEQVIKYVDNGNTLAEAYFLANKQDIINQNTTKIQQDTINKIANNGESTPGSLSDTGETPSFFTEAQVNKMSQAEVNKNLDLIHKSMKSW
jgi:ATP-dependent protease HslVU (ClpYQ) ATPase subunit